MIHDVDQASTVTLVRSISAQELLLANASLRKFDVRTGQPYSMSELFSCHGTYSTAGQASHERSCRSRRPAHVLQPYHAHSLIRMSNTEQLLLACMGDDIVKTIDVSNMDEAGLHRRSCRNTAVARVVGRGTLHSFRESLYLGRPELQRPIPGTFAFSNASKKIRRSQDVDQTDQLTYCIHSFAVFDNGSQSSQRIVDADSCRKANLYVRKSIGDCRQGTKETWDVF